MPPRGVLDALRPGSPNAVTWQPGEAARIATVTVAGKVGTVLADRSLRLVGQRETTAEPIADTTWLTTLAAASVLAAWLRPEDETRALTDPPH